MEPDLQTLARLPHWAPSRTSDFTLLDLLRSWFPRACKMKVRRGTLLSNRFIFSHGFRSCLIWEEIWINGYNKILRFQMNFTCIPHIPNPEASRFDYSSNYDPQKHTAFWAVPFFEANMRHRGGNRWDLSQLAFQTGREIFFVRNLQDASSFSDFLTDQMRKFYGRRYSLIGVGSFS